MSGARRRCHLQRIVRGHVGFFVHGSLERLVSIVGGVHECGDGGRGERPGPSTTALDLAQGW
jgi:hypothetical protein